MEASEAYALTITPSLCDFDGKLSIPDCFSVFQDIAADHAERLGVGADAMFNRGLFWLTVKTKIHFLRRPAMPETVTVSTRPLAPEKVRSIREYRLTAGDELLAEGKTEWTVIETASGKIHPMADVFDPALELGREAGYTAPFCRIGPRFAPEERLGTYTVRSVDIDFGGHMNNVAYVRAVYGLLSTEARRTAPQNEVEIAFRSPCYEGESLTGFCRRQADAWELGLIKPDGTPAVLVRMA